MKRNLYFVFIAASLALLVSAPGRLAYGLPLVLELNLLAFGATAFNSIMKKVDLGPLRDILTLSFIIFLTILYRQFLALYSPVLALALSFTIYLPAASAFLLGCVYSEQANPVGKNASVCAKFSVFAAIFFLLRDILGYGTISLPARNAIREIVLFDSYKTSLLSFLATIPGALLIFVFLTSVLLTAQTRMIVIEKAEADNESN